MARQSKITLFAADLDGLVLSVTPAAGGVQTFTLSGALTTTNPDTGLSEYIADAPRVLGIGCAGNETGRTFTIVGEDHTGAATTEAITGVSAATVDSTTLWKKVSSITVDADTAGAIVIGTTAIVTTQFIPTNLNTSPFNIGLMVTIGGTATAAVQHTLDDIQDSSITPDVLNHDSLTALTASADGNYAFPCTAFRLALTGFTSSAVEFTWAQAGLI